MTRYIPAFSWTPTIARFVREIIDEHPLLNVCSGREPLGDVGVNLYMPSDVRAPWTSLPFASDSFAAVFADPPWGAEYKKDVAAFMREALRVAPIAYLMAPWIYGAAWAELTDCWVREMPGVNQAIVVSRYRRKMSAH